MHMKVKMCGDEKWKKEAMMDDAVVANLLLQLNAPPPNKQPLSIKWKVRQRRSKTLTVNGGKTPLTRASPTTPLSYSGGTSVSGGGGGGSGGAVDGGSEESSLPQPPPKILQSSRSKVTSEATTGKKPRKKKTLAELKTAELALEEERKQLIEQVKRIRANLDRERSSHQKLKRLKLELESQTANKAGGPCSSNQVPPSFHQIEKLASSDPQTTATLPRMDSIETSPKEHLPFVIPDLNLPLEDDCNIEVQCEARKLNLM